MAIQTPEDAHQAGLIALATLFDAVRAHAGHAKAIGRRLNGGDSLTAGDAKTIADLVAEGIRLGPLLARVDDTLQVLKELATPVASPPS